MQISRIEKSKLIEKHKFSYASCNKAKDDFLHSPAVEYRKYFNICSCFTNPFHQHEGNVGHSIASPVLYVYCVYCLSTFTYRSIYLIVLSARVREKTWSLPSRKPTPGLLDIINAYFPLKLGPTTNRSRKQSLMGKSW